MKNIFLVFGLLGISTFANALSSISAYDAISYVGKSVTVCGTLVGVKPYKNNLFLNLEKPYPNQPFYFYIKNSDSQQLSKANSKVGKKVCGTGIVEVYKGRVEIQKNSVNELF
ncbi:MULTISPECIES: hypothetical protein [Acinetobacter]|uniref:hypothetical protein n=1 Tax=Acinetobacter TaxID=469 RepID=UPI00141B496E|nr:MULTISPECIES: hypothetical protein [Acinetobacter]MCS4300141.1 hypothetical protein [Acinetobacter guillouiae]MCW2251295.1 hypothetical protein [Acinetobacter sp. BIGb0204]NII36207.1 hypothetical protein [Acinetobacter sp. BIGb0196]